jgi:L-ascorbate metabolism protein UlaG (beta-lactamase superfamily)
MQLIFTCLLATILSSCANQAQSAPYVGEDHFDRKSQTFFNPWLKGKGVDRGLWDVIKWKWNSDPTPWPEKVEKVATPNLPTKLEMDQVAITFINHSTFLIQLPGLNILTDPIWSERTSPVSFAGPKRVIEPGLEFSQLPKIDVVLISHNHYDHLDLPTLAKLNAIHKPKFYVPMFNKKFLEGEGIKNVIQMDWWASNYFGEDIKISFVPAQHFSGRGLFDRNETLWGGFVIKYKSFKLYFAGDTGYAPLFKEIAERFDGIDMAFLPVGAYEPRWFMKEMHINPAEAVQAHFDLKAQVTIGMHFGCFQLADEGYDIPIEDLQKAKLSRGISNDSVRVLDVGQTLYYKMKIIEKPVKLNSEGEALPQSFGVEIEEDKVRAIEGRNGQIPPGI